MISIEPPSSSLICKANMMEINDMDVSTHSYNTNSSCFLCLIPDITLSAGAFSIYNDADIYQQQMNPFPNLPIKTERGASAFRQHSLRSICRYLKICVEQVLTASPDCKGFTDEEHVKKFVEEKGSDFAVRLCGQCSSIVVPLSNICMELELLQMKIDHYLKSLNGMLDTTESEETTAAHQVEESHQEYVKLLRKEIKRKCQVRLNQMVPNVKLSPVKLSERSLRLEPPSEEIKLIQNTPTIELSNWSPQNSDISDGEDEETGGKNLQQQNRWKSDFRTRTGAKSFSGYKTCNLCDPPHMVNMSGIRHHKIGQHVDHWFMSAKQSHLTMSQFKEYCDYVVHVELLSSQVLYDDRGNPTSKCPNCSYAVGMKHKLRLRHHVCSVHKDTLARKLVELQRSTPLEELRTIQLPSSCWSGMDLTKQDSPVNHPKVKRGRSKLGSASCDICGKVFRLKSSIWKHKRVAHDNITSVSKCTICGKIFKFSWDLTRHNKSVHDKDGNVHQRRRKRRKRKSPSSMAVIPEEESVPGNGISPIISFQLEDMGEQLVIPNNEIFFEEEEMCDYPTNPSDENGSNEPANPNFNGMDEHFNVIDNEFSNHSDDYVETEMKVVVH